jgi:hypothetical protein
LPEENSFFCKNVSRGTQIKEYGIMKGYENKSVEYLRKP